MLNRWGIPAEVVARLRARDTTCVYCGKQYSDDAPRNRPSIEHLDEHPPVYWRDGLKEADLAFCCHGCNSSRGSLPLAEWFRRPYCNSGGRLINEDTVADPVRAFLARCKRPKP